MKKIIITAFAFATGFVASAQTVNFGLKGGLNMATIDRKDDNSGIDNRFAYRAGVFANIPVSPQISIQPEAVYSSQGAKYNTTLSGVHSLELNYVNIPVMLQAAVGRGFYAEVGPQLGILTGVTDKVNGTETGFYEKEDFKSSDVSLGVGLGYKGRTGLGIDARYNLGLSNINNFGTASIKNNVLQVGLLFQLGR